MSTKPSLTADEKSRAKAFVDGWKVAGPLLERERERQIRDSDTARSIPAFDGLLKHAIKRFPAQPTSGLIELQRLLRKMNDRDRKDV